MKKANQVARARPWLLISNTISWTNYIFATARPRAKAALIAGLVGVLVVAAASAIVSWHLLWIAPIVIAAPAIGLFWEARSRAGRSTITVGAGVLDVGQVSKSIPLITIPHLEPKDGPLVIYDLRLSQLLWGSQRDEEDFHPPARLAKQPKVLGEEVAGLKNGVLTAIYRAKTDAKPYNGRVASQTTTLNADSLRSGSPFEFRRSRYFDLICSDYLADKLIGDSAEPGRTPKPGLEFVLNDRGEPAPLEESGLAAAVGVSTIALDADNKLILILQSHDALSSGGLLAPSGSGSLEPRDVRVAQRWSRFEDPSLFEVVAEGMNRELVEEANIRRRDVEHSSVLGAFRWLSKGAKPEYVGLTLLRTPVHDLKVRMTERKWVKEIIDVQVDFNALMNDPDNPKRAVDMEALLERLPKPPDDAPVRIEFSVPLHMCLKVLGDRLRQDRRFWTYFAARWPQLQEPAASRRTG